MKKTTAIILCILLICSCSVPVFAEQATYATAGEWYQANSLNLPDYIGGVWSRDGGTTNLVLGIVNNEEAQAARQEILELLEDDSTVTFVEQEFSRNYLYEIFEEIHDYFDKEMGLVCLGTSDSENRVIMELAESYQEDPNSQKMLAEIAEKYGCAVTYEYIHCIPVVDDGTEFVQNLRDSEEEKESRGLVCLYCPILPVALLLGIIILAVTISCCLRRKKQDAEAAEELDPPVLDAEAEPLKPSKE